MERDVLVCERPKNKVVHGTRFVRKYKWDPGDPSTFTKTKSRQGYRLKKGVDFTDGFSAVVHQETVKVFLYIVVLLSLQLCKMDIKTFFLYGDLGEDGDVYCEQPPGFEIDPREDYCCKPKHCLYGHPEAAKQAQKKLDTTMRKIGFEPIKSDSRLFIKRTSEGIIIVIIHVDDPGIGHNNKIVAVWKQFFEFTAENNPSSFLGMTLEWQGATLRLSQENYVNDFVKFMGLENSNPKPTPMVPNKNNQTSMQLHEEERKRDPNYQACAGKLIYLLNTRFDCAYAINVLCRRMAASNKQDDNEMKRIGRYLKKKAKLGLAFKPSPDRKLSIFAYVDASLADCKDHKSTGGYMVCIGEPTNVYAVICAKSFKERLVAQSSCEAEVYALVEAAKFIVWLRFLLAELGLEQKGPTVMYEDNEAVIELVNNPTMHARTKHFRIRQYMLRDLKERNVIDVLPIDTNENLADMLTKALNENAHSKFVNQFMI